MATATKERKTKRRRGSGEGTIFQRTDGRWCAAIANGCDASGKRRRRWIYRATKGEVTEELTRLQGRKLDGTLGDAGRLSVGKYLDQWLESSAKATVRATTYVSYKGVIENHIKPRIGGLSLAKLAPAHVQAMYATMEDNKKSARLRQLTHAVLRRSLNQAVKWNMVPRNVCNAVYPPRVARKEIRPLTAEQVKLLLKAAAGDESKAVPADPLEALYVLAVTTGLRLGELFGLQWADVDLTAGCLHVRYTLMEVNGKLSLSEPKTARSRRKVELPAFAVEALRGHQRSALAAGGREFATEGHVFRNSRGGPLRRSHFHADSFKPLLKRAKLPAIRFHDLRHTAATLMLAGGEHPKVVQELLGHSQISVTMDTYSHVLPTMQREAIDRLGKLLSASAG